MSVLVLLWSVLSSASTLRIIVPPSDIGLAVAVCVHMCGRVCAHVRGVCVQVCMWVCVLQRKDIERYSPFLVML